jgi:hypothetical protein
MTEITQEQIDEIRKVASRNICDCESCRREFDYVFRLAWQKAQDETRKEVDEILNQFWEEEKEDMSGCVRLNLLVADKDKWKKLKSQINPEDKTV